MAIEYSKHRVTFGEPLASRQAIQWMHVDNEIDIRTGRWLCLAAADKAEQEQPFRFEAAMAKVYGTEAAGRVVDRSIQVHGALGYSTDTPLAHMYQHARWARFADGADEIHQMRIAQRTIAAYQDHGTTRPATGNLPV